VPDRSWYWCPTSTIVLRDEGMGGDIRARPAIPHLPAIPRAPDCALATSLGASRSPGIIRMMTRARKRAGSSAEAVRS